MTALDTSLDRFIVSRTGSLAAAAPSNMRDAMMRLLLDMGFTDFVLANSPPVNRNALWWHKDVKQAKRYNVTSGAWVPLTPGEFALYQAKRCIQAAQTESSLEVGDLFGFLDVSANEFKGISKDNLRTAIGAGAVTFPAWWIAERTQVNVATVTWNVLGSRNLTASFVGGDVSLTSSIAIPKAFVFRFRPTGDDPSYLGDWAVSQSKGPFVFGSQGTGSTVFVGLIVGSLL
ncbi:MAG: hypothetical protein J0H34_22320 [Rhizobiales bacterium]|nr:hypothetical protein [Hyphomicrobiales bacterium]